MAAGRPRVRPDDDWSGLNVEAAWLLLDAADALNEPRERVAETALCLINHALAYGFDWKRGGLARYGPPSGRVAQAVYLGRDRLAKLWWVQAELLVAAIEAHRIRGAPRYFEAFEKEFPWIWTHRIDHESGGWFDSTTWREGRSAGDGRDREGAESRFTKFGR